MAIIFLMDSFLQVFSNTEIESESVVQHKLARANKKS